jgi:hypothetical protein
MSVIYILKENDVDLRVMTVLSIKPSYVLKSYGIL